MEKIERPVGGDDEALEGDAVCDVCQPPRNTDRRGEKQVDVGKYFDWLRTHIRRRYPLADEDELFQMCAVAALEAGANGYDSSRGTFRYYLEHFVVRSTFQEYL